MKNATDEIDKPQALGAYDLLRREILHGELMPGDRLRVADLNDRYKLGLTPIREALVRLTSEGLVASESHRGARVRDISLDEFSDMMQTRRELERLCLAKAIHNGSADWEGEVLKAFHLLSRAPLPASAEDVVTAAQWEQFHRQFHFSLVSACGSPWLLQFWNTLVDHSERYRKLRLLFWSSGEAEVRDINKEHETIMKAALSRDVEATAALMDDHLTQTERAVMKLLAMRKDRKG